MKIHLISNMYPSLKSPTYGTFVKKTYEQLADSPNIYITKTVLIKEKNKLLKLIRYAFFYAQIVFKLLFLQYDYIYVHYVSHSALPILFVSKIKKLNIIVNVHGSDVTSTLEKDAKFEKSTNKIFQISRKIIVPSSFMKRFIMNKYDLTGNNIEIYPSGGVNDLVFNTNIDKSSIVVDSLKLERDKLLFSYVSRIDEGKGWDITLHALKEMQQYPELLNKIEFLFVGSGSREQQLKETIEKLNLKNIHWISSQPQNELAKIYQNSKWVVFPSQLPESLGLVGLESMACGTPIIGTNIGGIATYLKDGINGLSFEKGDFSGLAEKLSHAIELDEVTYRKMRTDALKTSDEYLSSKIQDKLVDIFI